MGEVTLRWKRSSIGKSSLAAAAIVLGIRPALSQAAPN
jgi:hypothetical protein